ncbi:hypothetical protein [Mycobacterium sp.]|uniref:hypothetical protein n=1 Tax=Mycobacterium sp. TaxID=1785 RepID=UPI003F944465
MTDGPDSHSWGPNTPWQSGVGGQPPPPGQQPLAYGDGTAKWGTPDISGIKITLFDPYHLEVLFSGQTTFVLVAHTRSGASKAGPVTAFVSGKADVRQSPPAVALR